MEAGYREIVLTGIHTGGYGEDLRNIQLADLLWDLDKIDGLKRIRISSIEASQIDERIIEVLNASDKMCRHLHHIPLQAGDDAVLKRMRRKYTVAEYRQKIEQIKAAMPRVAITSDVIVGFPGETEEQFENGYQLIKELQFAEIFMYFPTPYGTGTPAARMPDQVPAEIKQERVQKLIDLSNQLSLDDARQFVGEVLDVIPERRYKENPDSGLLVGYSHNYIQIAFPGNDDLVGKVCRVRLDEPGAEVCMGTFARTLEDLTSSTTKAV